MAVVDASRLRGFGLARRVSSYIATSLILTTVLAVSTSVAQQTATTLQKVSGDNQSALFNTKLPNSLVVKVLDQNGAAMSGVTVSFAKTQGDGGSVTPTSDTTGSNGQASTSLTLGTANAPGQDPNTYKVTASVTGLTSVVFTATGLTPSSISAVDNSDAQSGPAGEWLPNPLVVVVADQNYQPLQGAPITWTLDLQDSPSADAKLSQTKTKTDANGKARTRLKLGSKTGKYHVKASVPNVFSPETSTLAATATAARSPDVRVHQFRQGRGASQRIVTKQSSTDPIIVRVLDDHNEPLRGAEVNFSVEPSDGVLNPLTARTGANGQASTILTFGAVNLYTVTATVVTDPSIPELSPLTFVVEKQIEQQVEKQKRRIIYECPVGWTRGSVFGNTKKALIYELKVNVDHTHRVSIYELASLAIYVHPEENLETLDGWYLTTGILYNHDHENKFQLTAENSAIDEHGFAHIKNPDATPIRMGTLGFIGQSLPSFDYRLYDERGIRVDFGISCYKEGGLTWRLYNTKDPRVLRMLPFPMSEDALSVRMKELDWQTPFFRTQWTAAVMPDLPDAPVAPSLVKKNIVGTWADLKKR